MRVVGSKRCSLDGLAMSVILEAINLAGEPRKLAEYSKAYLAPQLNGGSLQRDSVQRR